MGAISDDEDDFSMKKISPSKPLSHLKFIEDPEAVSITKQELEALKAELAQTKRRSLENEARSKLAQDRSLENQKRLLSERDEDVVVVALEPEPKKKRGRPPLAKDKEQETNVKEAKPKSQAMIAKEIKKVEAKLKDVQKLYTKELKFCKDQKAVMEQVQTWFTTLATKPEYKEHAHVFNKINSIVGTLYNMRDQLEKMKRYNYPELKERGHPLADLQTYLLALGNAMETTAVLECKLEHQELKAKREELLALQKSDDEFELK